jgi:hypothetical protein
LLNDKFHNLYSSTNVKVIKSKSLSLVEYVARMGENKKPQYFTSKNIKEIGYEARNDRFNLLFPCLCYGLSRMTLLHKYVGI